MKIRTALVLVILAEAAVAALAIYSQGWSLDGLQFTTRYSGRLSLFIFSFIFLLHPNKKESLTGLLSENYYLAFAVAHGIHLIELLSFVTLSGTVLVPCRVAGGFLAYLLIFLMPILYARKNAGKLTESRFNNVGYVYIFYVWFIFFMTYIARINGSFSNQGDNHLEHRVLLGWVCLMLGIKISGLFLKRSKA
jgi:hypothetical protein